MPSYGMDELTWDADETDETGSWIPEFPLERALMVNRAIDRYAFFRYMMGFSEEKTLEEVYRFYPELKPDA